MKPLFGVRQCRSYLPCSLSNNARTTRGPTNPLSKFEWLKTLRRPNRGLPSYELDAGRVSDLAKLPLVWAFGADCQRMGSSPRQSYSIGDGLLFPTLHAAVTKASAVESD